jgi:hypothetical protein
MLIPSYTKSVAVEGLGAIQGMEALPNERIGGPIKKISQKEIASFVADESTHPF